VRDQTRGELAADDQGPPEWTLDSLTAAARDAGIDIRRSQIRRILRQEGVRWRRTRSWATSHDPEFVPKDHLPRPRLGLLHPPHRPAFRS
jgi:transposase